MSKREKIVHSFFTCETFCESLDCRTGCLLKMINLSFYEIRYWLVSINTWCQIIIFILFLNDPLYLRNCFHYWLSSPNILVWYNWLPLFANGFLSHFSNFASWASPCSRCSSYRQLTGKTQFVQQTGLSPDSKVHGANMGPIWGRQDPGGPYVGPMNFDIWVLACDHPSLQ